LTIDSANILPTAVDTRRDIQSLATEQARYPELKRIGAGALAVWVLAFVFGAAFWTLLVRIAAP
jgi:hypothetical protein